MQSCVNTFCKLLQKMYRMYYLKYAKILQLKLSSLKRNIPTYLNLQQQFRKSNEMSKKFRD